MRSADIGVRDRTRTTDVLDRLHQEMLTELDQALQQEEPLELKARVTAVLRTAVQLRDDLTTRLREARTENDRDRLRGALDQVNVAISLLAAVEYPMVGIQRKSLETAREVLESVKFS
ncbi:MAG: hypothetical protein M5U01_03200 [Ardenticatenaceae bacterium]|nr:hypothetical protein [Ardenticatenaceae bacterium]